MNDVVARWIDESKRKGAFWEHNGDSARPHLVTPEGEHTNTRFDRRKATEDPILLQSGAFALLKHLEGLGLDPLLVTRTLGVGRGSAGLAHAVAHIISYSRPSHRIGDICCSAYMDDPIGTLDRRANVRVVGIEEGEHVLVLFESFTPATARFALESVERMGARPARFVGALANFSGMKEMERHKVGALIERDFRKWASQEACSLCAEGSEAISPTSKADWRRLLRQ